MSETVKTRITVSLAGLVAAAFATYGIIAWASGRASVESVVQLDTRVTVLESQYTVVLNRLDRIESKVDRVIEGQQ